MAGNRVNAKTKGKEDKSKLNKNVTQNNEDSEDLDYSLLRKPIPTSVTGFAQARKVFDLATEELKELLTNECDLLYECKVCRNLFRSLMNFISHKRIYCKEKFNCTVHSHFTSVNSTANELLKIKKFEENYLEFLKDKSQEPNENIEENDAIPMTKDLTTVIEKIVTSRGIQEDQLKEQEVILQKIPKTSVAVYQNIKYNDSSNVDDMRTQVNELDTILSRQNAVLQSDGKFKIESNVDSENEGVIQISDDEENDCLDNLKCKICELQFSTQKTLKSHIKTKHLESRLVYPCPDCLEIFSTSWSVYRHLFKVHRKTAAQIRRLRETIQSKAFRMNNPPAFYEKRKSSMKIATAQKITEEERIDQENQAWMDNMEGDGELPRCGGCGRTFERRAALAAHTNTCQPRVRALAAARRPHDAKRIEIQIRKDYHKGPPPKEKNTTEEAPSPSKPQVQKEKKEVQNENTLTEAIMSIVGVTGNQEVVDSEPIEQITEDPPKPSFNVDSFKPMHKLRFSHQAEKSNFNALKRKVLHDVDIDQLSCKKCEFKCKQANELYNHVAGHFKWLRYACKLCNFKHYEFEKVPEHVKIVHKLKGDSDFYFSTVKAIDGVEATMLSDVTDETSEANETSPDSRRPSRCSSDSSRLSDDSSSSSTRIETGSRKRKSNPYRSSTRKKREVPNDEADGDSKDGEDSPQKDVIQLENDSSSNSKIFDENSSDIDDSEEKTSKRLRLDDMTSVAPRRPVRKRTRPKNEDFEYDLSNLLKMEAQGYRDSISVSNVKAVSNKKKRAHMKTTNFTIFTSTKEQRISNIFVRPMLPKISRIDKTSLLKEPPENKDNTTKSTKVPDANESVVQPVIEDGKSQSPPVTETNENIKDSNKVITETKDTKEVNDENPASQTTASPTTESSSQDKTKSNLNLVPIKFRKQSLDLMKNPLIKKNITDFSKAGMKTKILVIKPLNRKDGAQTINAPLKFQTIKLKEPVNISNDEKKPDQVVVVKVPKVECARAVKGSNNNNESSSDAKVADSEKEKAENCDSKISEEKYNESDKQEVSNNNSDRAQSETFSTEISVPVTDTDVAVQS
ncbi:uncharacterized protein LOC119838296 [Zerene cesonia]|uniref:uncharacterized protein LOC119838296 n=1 Tax=Zerene cesonia TaxID=33412 RepID=UPI0018E56DD3|nr:uncharacterized protein LOC119838296 [Zerene cesonia]